MLHWLDGIIANATILPSHSNYAEGRSGSCLFVIMPRAELLRHTVVVLSVSHYAEGGATEAYCSRVVCHSVRHAYLVIR